MTTAEAVARGIPRWMLLSHLAEDVQQIAALVEIEYATPGQRSQALRYYLRCLRRDQWERRPVRPVKRPEGLKPSKRKKATGYRTNPERHRTSRAKVPRITRILIASAGGMARKRGQHAA